jgi:hypothetical protein
MKTDFLLHESTSHNLKTLIEKPEMARIQYHQACNKLPVKFYQWTILPKMDQI